MIRCFIFLISRSKVKALHFFVLLFADYETTCLDLSGIHFPICVQEGEQMIQEGHPRSERFREAIDELWSLWGQLEQVMSDRQQKLLENEIAQQYLFDASEAEAWMGEQELYLMGDERAKVRWSISRTFPVRL